MTVLRFLVKLIWGIILLSLITVACIFAVTYRKLTEFSVWPLPIELSLPLGATILAAFAIGLIVGMGFMSILRLRLRYRTLSNERRTNSIEKIVQDANTPSSTPVIPDQTQRRAIVDQ